MPLDPAAVVRAYRVVFGSPDGRIVLQDMLRFCLFRADINDQIGEGKRRAFLHILEHAKLDDDQIIHLYTGRGRVLPLMEDDDGGSDAEP